MSPVTALILIYLVPIVISLVLASIWLSLTYSLYGTINKRHFLSRLQKVAEANPEPALSRIYSRVTAMASGQTVPKKPAVGQVILSIIIATFFLPVWLLRASILLWYDTDRPFLTTELWLAAHVTLSYWFTESGNTTLGLTLGLATCLVSVLMVFGFFGRNSEGYVVFLSYSGRRRIRLRTVFYEGCFIVTSYASVYYVFGKTDKSCFPETISVLGSVDI